jgi:protein gp37
MTTKIRWTQIRLADGTVRAGQTWNPVTGCSRVSAGCKHCYAEQLSLRFGWSKKPWTARNASVNVQLHPERLRKPYTWKTPSRVFVNSMSDLFHPLVPDDFITQIFAVMSDLPQHTFQILTKRPERAALWAGPWPANIWMGTSVEDHRAAHRIHTLRRCGAAVRFLSIEPLLGPLGPIDLTDIDWVIVGGESGRNYRPMNHDWARAVRDACVEANVAFFFKQDSGPRTEMRPWLDGMIWEQYPGDLAPPRPAEMPTNASAVRTLDHESDRKTA